MCEYVIIKYLRLSLDDKISDSMSIPNQRDKLNYFISEMPEFSGATVLEFVDNGYSGTNFERPDFQRMLELVTQGKVHCIIVKDFSRFGRNALEMGYFIEQVFPLFRVRFISIDDNFDSDANGATGSDVAFKFYMHEHYSREKSTQVKTAKRSKALRGESVIKDCLYGYMLDAGRRMVIDEPAAEIVRFMFKLASDGKSPSDIRKALFERKVPTPSEYKAIKKGKLKGEPAYLWANGSTTKILTDERYIGTYISGTAERVEVGRTKTVPVDRSKWIIIPDHHPAVVDKAVFDEAQEKLKMFLRPKGHKGYTIRQYPLRGKVYCGSCHHTMNRDPIKIPLYRCRHTKVNPDAACRHLTVRERDIEKVLMEIIRKQLKVLLNTDDTADLTAFDVRLAEQRDQDNQITLLEDKKQSYYERFVSQEISADTYRRRKSELDAEINRLRQSRTAFAEQTERLRLTMERQNVFSAAVKEAKGKHGLTQALSDLLIEKVLVFPDNRLEILWKFEDFTITKRKGEPDENSGYLLPNGIERRYRHRKSAENVAAAGA